MVKVFPINGKDKTFTGKVSGVDDKDFDYPFRVSHRPKAYDGDASAIDP